MNTLLSASLIFLELLVRILIFDVILSWLALVWIKRPKFIADILDPIYNLVKKYLPTTFWPLDFTPIFLFLLLYFLQIFIIWLTK
jgi:uncharacterized protein YggT (Ycf19 family)